MKAATTLQARPGRDWISVKELMILHGCHQMKVLAARNTGAVSSRRNEAGALEMNATEFADWIAFHPVKPSRKATRRADKELTVGQVRAWLKDPENLKKLGRI